MTLLNIISCISHKEK